MAKNKTFTVPYKRKVKTNYRKRLKYLTSDKTRIVIRVSNNDLMIQAVNFQEEGDKVITQVKSTDLKKQGWTHPTGNNAASYLTGLLFAKKAGLNQGTVDLGFKSITKGARLAAAIGGLEKGGLEISYKKEIAPEESKFKDKYSDYEKVKNKIQGEK